MDELDKYTEDGRRVTIHDAVSTPDGKLRNYQSKRSQKLTVPSLLKSDSGYSTTTSLSDIQLAADSNVAESSLFCQTESYLGKSDLESSTVLLESRFTQLKNDYNDLSIIATPIYDEHESFKEAGTPLTTRSINRCNKCDILGRLEFFGAFNAVSMILRHLPSSALHRCTLVSKAWRKLISRDCDSRERLNVYMKCRELSKENLNISGSIIQQGLPCIGLRNGIASPLAAVASPNNILPDEQRLLNHRFSNDHFQLFCDIAKNLSPSQSLQHCPNCRSPATVTLNHVACTSMQCNRLFCKRCKSVLTSDTQHSCPSTPINCSDVRILALNNSSRLIGSSQSRRNLKRL